MPRMRGEIQRLHRLRLGIQGLLAAFLLAFPLAAQAKAASFDCAQAARPLEKLICADADLSRLDDDMTGRYRNALARLSPAGQAILRQGQRDWISFTRTHCEARIGKPANSFGGDARQCLENEYKGRIRLLESAAQRIGPYLFSHIAKYFLVPSVAGDEGGSRSGFVFAEVSIPRIDTPMNEDTIRWNAMAEAWMRANSNVGENVDCDLTVKCISRADEDLSVEYVINSAQPGFISLSNFVYLYGHGLPHGFDEIFQSNFLLTAGRELTEDDLFRPESQWRQTLVSEGLKTITAERPELTPTADDIDSLIEGPKAWSITADALIVQIPLWLRYGYSNGSAEVTIPWRDLKPYLRANLPITLNVD
jgi:uncharacterized protein